MIENLSTSKENFIQFALENEVLKFGSFILKSGRVSPYFCNLGLINEGSSLKKLGEFYADLLLKELVNCQHLFGPAYKGIPLATSVAIALAERDHACKLSFNRKEIKDHGEGGQIIGAELQGETVMIDDVISAGTAFRESKALIEAHGGYLSTVAITLNRCERGIGKTSAIDEIRAAGIKVVSLIDFHDLVSFLKKKGYLQEAKKMEEYYQQYGC